MNPADLRPSIPEVERPRAPAPLLPAAIGIMVGIAADDYHGIHFGWWTLLAAAGAVPVLARRGHGYSAWIGLVLAGAAVGGVRHAVADRWLASNHVVFLVDDEPILARVSGRVVSTPRLTEPAENRRLAYRTGPRTRFVLDAAEIAGPDGPVRVRGRVAVSVHDAVLDLHDGDRVSITGWLYRPLGPRNPGAYDWATHQRRNGLYVGLSCRHGAGVRVLSRGAASGVLGLAQRARARLRGYLLDDAFADDDPAAGVITAMVLGERSAVSRAMNEAFVRTGNAHFLAASGMHVAWLSLLGWWILTRLMGMYYRRAAWLVLLLIVSYVLIAEPRPSILRAGIVGVLACLSIIRRGRHHSVNWLAAAAIIILMIDPADLFRPAFGFSFAAVLGLLHLCPRLSTRIAELFAKLKWYRAALAFDKRLYPATLARPIRSAGGLLSGVGGTVAYWAAQLFAIALSQWLITTPLACYYFNVFTLWGWFGSLTTWFLALPATSLGFVTVLSGLVFPSSGEVLRPLTAGATELMVDYVTWLSQLAGPPLDGRSPSVAWVVAVYVVAFLWVKSPRWPADRRPAWLRTPHGFKIAGVVLLLWWWVPGRWIKHEPDALHVWMLAVGNGTATIIELPNGKVLAYDFGTRSSFDAVPLGVGFLQHRGIRRLDAVFVSHANFDHFSAITGLAEKFEIGRVIVNDHFESFSQEHTTGRRFLDELRDAGIPVEIMRGPRTWEDTGEVRVESIWPPASGAQRFLDANDSSTVLRLTYQGRSILLTGDIAEFAMGKLLERHDLDADALALPHHGSVVANTPAFIAAVSPEIAVRSSAESRNSTISGIEDLVSGMTYLGTADDGCVRITIRDGRITAASMADGI